MLAFKKNGYTRESLIALYYSLSESACNMCIGCDRDFCYNCPKALPQQDLFKLTTYIEHLIAQS